MYIILVGMPGIGKGLAIDAASNLMRHWKKSDVLTQSNVQNPDQNQLAFAEMTGQSDLDRANKSEMKPSAKQEPLVEPLLFPMAADATTYEALVQSVSASVRAINYSEFSEKAQKNVDRVYTHSSLAFYLQELASLLRKRAHDTVNYLLALYDCPIDYEYSTLTRGKDRVRKGCLNMLAGTTPHFMSTNFSEELIGEGFTSRVFYIFASKNRKNVCFIPSLTKEQEDAKKDLLEHIKRISCLYGSCEIDKEVIDYMEDWWDKSEKNKHKRASKSLKMVPYYARKQIHAQKLAMCLHFMESTEMKVPLERFIEAINFLEEEEKMMHLAITLEDDNPEARVAKTILLMLNSGKKHIVEILMECHGMLNKKGIEDSLSFLIETHQIVIEVDRDIETKEIIEQYYKLKG